MGCCCSSYRAYVSSDDCDVAALKERFPWIGHIDVYEDPSHVAMGNIVFIWGNPLGIRGIDGYMLQTRNLQIQGFSNHWRQSCGLWGDPSTPTKEWFDFQAIVYSWSNTTPLPLFNPIWYELLRALQRIHSMYCVREVQRHRSDAEDSLRSIVREITAQSNQIAAPIPDTPRQPVDCVKWVNPPRHIIKENAGADIGERC